MGFQAGPRTPEIDPGHFVSARFDFGFLGLGPLRLGIVFLCALRVLHLLFRQKGFVGSSCFGWGVFPPFSKGEMLPVFVILFFFRVRRGVFCRFFSVLLFLGSLFGKNFRE